MMTRAMTEILRRGVSYVAFAACGLAVAVQAATIQEITDAGEARTEEAAAQQRRIDTIDDQIEQIVLEYKTVDKVVDGLKVYNGLLQRQIDNQEAEKVALAESIDNVALIERQITPLMTRMIDSIEEFIELDTPFLLDERRGRVARLRAMMERSDVTAAEKLRQVLEAFSIESDYGRTIEAYKGSLEIDGNMREVDFLRIGRVSLSAQTVGGGTTKGWNNRTREWEELSPETYKQAVATGLRIADKQVAPDLIVAPVAAPQEVGQ
ncbi:MAG: DUF3450 domain-containing protein [Xanthomonadales bacterium]|nr:DUF3450 domain-containing protein [Xanthomonadales bacterium]